MDRTQKITKNLGGDRIGSGSKNNITLHAYNRSTHELSRAWRSTMTTGTLVPFLKEVALPGDTWSIDLEAVVRTIPTIGPLYGSYKLQMDVYECPMRLYNGLLHNNMTKIGMKMEQVKIPTMTINGLAYRPGTITHKQEDYQIASNSLLKYLGISGICDARNYAAGQDIAVVTRHFNAIPLLAYWDIYKNYYANKQEEKGAVIGSRQSPAKGYLVGINVTADGSSKDYPLTGQNQFIPNTYTPYNTYQGVLAGEKPVLTSTTDITIACSENIEPASVRIVISAGGAITSTPVTNAFQDVRIIGNHIQCTLYLGGMDELIGFDYYATTITEGKIDIITFPLDNIDQMRIDILQATGLNNAIQVDNTFYTPYGMYGSNTVTGDSANSLPMYGLALKTYQSDLFENWLKTEWIDGVGGINEITAIDTSSGSFQIDALNLANKVYNMLNRIAVSGGSYEDYIEAVYSIEANRRAESPVYKGGMSCEIVFEEVVATAQTSEQPLGTLGGKGTVTNKRGGQIEIKVDEPSYIIGLVSITPRIDYSQGNDWDMTELITMNDLHKPALDGIGFEDLLQERMAWFGTYYDITADKFVKLAAGKTPAWINYMTAVNKSYGDFANQNAMWMTLNRRYSSPRYVTQTGIQDLTTYIDPRKYNYNFAEQDLEANNFWVQIGAKIITRRVMSAKIIPNL